MTTTQTFNTQDGTATLQLPSRPRPYRIVSITGTWITDPASPPAVTPVLEIQHGQVCFTARMAGQPLPPSYTLFMTWALGLNNEVVPLNAVSSMATRALPELVIEQNDQVTIRTAEGDATVTVDALTVLTEEIGRGPG